MTIPVAIHLITALAALGFGSFVLLRPKGTPMHKAFGRTWVGLIVITSIVSFGIFQIREGAGFSIIHLLSVWTLFAVTMGVLAIRRGKVRNHAGWMIGTFSGLVIAGAIALSPNRLLSELLFG